MFLEGRNPDIVCEHCCNNDFVITIPKVKPLGYDEFNTLKLAFISLSLKCKECGTNMNIAFTFDVSNHDDLRDIPDILAFKLDSDCR